MGERGRAAGRLGEYIASRDSLALDPGRMTSEAQLRHTLAHELAHRWQARSVAQLAALWRGTAAIRDPKRYGYDNVSEHQAEAAAFAVHFLLATAAASWPRWTITSCSSPAPGRWRATSRCSRSSFDIRCG